jgi:2-keto-4-pentenoate hydratase
MSFQAATLLAQARQQNRRLSGLPDSLRPGDVTTAYSIQAEVQALLLKARGSAAAGYKIGCTTPVMQAFLNIPSPCSGLIAAKDVLTSPVRLRHADFLHVGVECEIAVRLAKPLEPGQAPFTRDTVADAVGACMPAIEIVDDRWDDYGTVDTPTLIADNFFHAACVLGPAVERWQELDLAAVEGVTVIDGVEVGRGRGADVMGHPFEALAWLANSLAARGSSLPAGAVVLTGSVVATRWLEPGAHVVVDLSGLGRAEAVFGS